MPGPHKGVLTQCTTQQTFAKPRHQPSERDKEARDRLRNKAKIKSHAYIQLGEKALQTVHQTYHSKPTVQQAATKDQVSQQTHPLQPGETRVYPSMLVDKQVPVLNLTKSSITSQADLQVVFDFMHLCSMKDDELSHGREESKEDEDTE